MDDCSMMVQHRQPSTRQGVRNNSEQSCAHFFSTRNFEKYLEYSTSNQLLRNPYYGCAPVSSSTGATRSHCPAEQDTSVPNPEYVTEIPDSTSRRKRRGKRNMFQTKSGHEIKDLSEEHLADTLVSVGVSETTSHSYFVCNYCVMSFCVEKDARNHVLMAHLYKLNILERYRCRAVGCLFTSNVKSSATRHCAEQGKPKWLCPVCGKPYLRKTYKHKCKDTNAAGTAAAFDHTVVQPQYGAQTFFESDCEQVCEGKAPQVLCMHYGI